MKKRSRVIWAEWSLVRGFVLVQGSEGKLGPIDDCLEAQLNLIAYTSTSYLKLQDVDYISGLALKIASAISSGDCASKTGKWLGKCLDLSKAYKQIGILPEHRYLSVIFCHDNNGLPRFYVSNALMFGATAAVYSFNPVSRSLRFLFNKMLLIPCGVFFDDYSSVVLVSWRRMLTDRQASFWTCLDGSTQELVPKVVLLSLVSKCWAVH